MKVLLKMIINMNQFEFNTQLYLQISGTANLFMGRFEKNLLEDYHHKPFLWLWCIDIFLIWTHSEQELNLFVEYANSVHPTILYTPPLSSLATTGLKQWVILAPVTSVLYTALYTNPMVDRGYLLHSLAHPLYCKDGGGALWSIPKTKVDR